MLKSIRKFKHTKSRKQTIFILKSGGSTCSRVRSPLIGPSLVIQFTNNTGHTCTYKCLIYKLLGYTVIKYLHVCVTVSPVETSIPPGIPVKKTYSDQ